MHTTCEHCQYYKSDYGSWTATGWSQDGSRGKCLAEPKALFVNASRIGCRHFKTKEAG